MLNVDPAPFAEDLWRFRVKAGHEGETSLLIEQRVSSAPGMAACLPDHPTSPGTGFFLFPPLPAWINLLTTPRKSLVAHKKHCLGQRIEHCDVRYNALPFLYTEHQLLLLSKSLSGLHCPANPASWQDVFVHLALVHPQLLAWRQYLLYHVLSAHWSGTPIFLFFFSTAAKPKQDLTAVWCVWGFLVVFFSPEPLLMRSEISCFWLVQSLHLPVHPVMPADIGVQSPMPRGVLMYLDWALGKVCPAVSCLPASMWLGGFLPSPVPVGGGCHSASSSLRAVRVCG